jgi:hypothetical protein
MDLLRLIYARIRHEGRVEDAAGGQGDEEKQHAGLERLPV